MRFSLNLVQYIDWYTRVHNIPPEAPLNPLLGGLASEVPTDLLTVEVRTIVHEPQNEKYFLEPYLVVAMPFEGKDKIFLAPVSALTELPDAQPHPSTP